MFILRSISKNTDKELLIDNITLGKKYGIVLKSKSPKQFNAVRGKRDWEYIYGYVSYGSDENTIDGIIPLHQACEHYIMTEGGKTFEKIFIP